MGGICCSNGEKHLVKSPLGRQDKQMGRLYKDGYCEDGGLYIRPPETYDLITTLTQRPQSYENSDSEVTAEGRTVKLSNCLSLIQRLRMRGP
jgi:hypothetical protein